MSIIAKLKLGVSLKFKGSMGSMPYNVYFN
jgi:hypothetical protein